MLDTLIGFTGTLLILTGFLMNQLGKWSTEDLVYDFINLLGASMLIVYSFILNSVPFMILNGVWAAVSLKDVIKDVKRKTGK